jgi:PAS domain-containing protein
MAVPIPESEAQRIAALRACDILDTAAEEIYDQIAESAREACETPIALLSFVDSDREWCKSHPGVAWSCTDRESSFCGYAILQPHLFVVENALADERFSGSPLVTGQSQVRFYAGIPVRTEEGHAIGMLAVLDRKPRSLSKGQAEALATLAESASRLVELRARHRSGVFAAAVNFSSDAIAVADVKDGEPTILYANKSFLLFAQCKYHEAIGRPFAYPCPPETATALQPALTNPAPSTVECEYDLQGSRRSDRMTVIPYIDEQCHVLYWIVIHREITLLKQAERDRHQLHAMQTTVRSINHIVLNFLNAAALFKQSAAGIVDTTTQTQFELAIQNTRLQLAALAQMEEFKERKTPFGFTVLDPPK